MSEGDEVMKAEYINPFIIAARQVLVTEIGTEINIGQLSLDPAIMTDMDVKVNIGVTGTLEGIVFYGMSRKTACDITSTMMGGEPVAEVDEMVHSAIAELGNVISGVATGVFEGQGIRTDITTPTVVVGEKVAIKTMSLKPILVNLDCSYGKIILAVALREGN